MERVQTLAPPVPHPIRGGVERSLLETACRIRALEFKLLALFREGRLSGTVHTSVGQEFCAAAFAQCWDPDRDALFATHRGHGWYVAAGGPVDGFFAELMGKQGGLCRGRGGSQHLHWRNFFSSGIQGGTAAIATGWAWAKKLKGEPGIAIAQIGDGTLGEGALYEALTFASVLRVPVLFVLEWNGYAQSTDVRATTPGDVLERVRGFGLPCDRRSDDDPDALRRHAERIVDIVRGGQPFFQIIETRRLLAHSKGDDSRPAAVIESLRRADPLSNLIEYDDDAAAMFERAQEEMNAVADAVAEWPAAAESMREESAWGHDDRPISGDDLRADESDETDGRIIDDVNRALHAAMARDPNVVVIGEDIADPYGGAFKASRGLSTRFTNRVFSTPIAEAAIAGVSNGLALGGMRPIAEIMFADFVTLAVDQIVNHAAKFHHMYGGTVDCPILVRLPCGGRRGYGPTHSQSTEQLFCGVPGVRVVACSQRHSTRRLMEQLTTAERSPTVLVEQKVLYALQTRHQPPLDLEPRPSTRSNGDYPPLCYGPRGGHPADVTLVTYGAMAGICEEALERLVMEDELRFELIVLTQLWPVTDAEVVESVRRTRRLVVAEEGVSAFGVGASLIAAVAQKAGRPFQARAVGMAPVPIPCARHLEDSVLPSADDVIAAVRHICN